MCGQSTIQTSKQQTIPQPQEASTNIVCNLINRNHNVLFLARKLQLQSNQQNLLEKRKQRAKQLESLRKISINQETEKSKSPPKEGIVPDIHMFNYKSQSQFSQHMNPTMTSPNSQKSFAKSSNRPMNLIYSNQAMLNFHASKHKLNKSNYNFSKSRQNDQFRSNPLIASINFKSSQTKENTLTRLFLNPSDYSHVSKEFKINFTKSLNRYRESKMNPRGTVTTQTPH